MPKPSRPSAASAAAQVAAQAASRNGRASPEAVAKRRAARVFNEVIAGPSPRLSDGRTERRRKRLFKELESGTTQKGADLKPIDVLLRAQALLDLGEPFDFILAARKPPSPVKSTELLVEGVRKLHEAYAFAPEVYALVGIEADVLLEAGVLREKREVRASGQRPAEPAPGPAKTGARSGTSRGEGAAPGPAKTGARSGTSRGEGGAPGPAKTGARSGTSRRGAA